jgi:hypothetical protein
LSGPLADIAAAEACGEIKLVNIGVGGVAGLLKTWRLSNDPENSTPTGN